MARGKSGASSNNNQKTGPRKSARIAQHAIVYKSRDCSGLNTDGHADSPELKELRNQKKMARGKSRASSNDNKKTGPRRSARIAQHAVVCKSRDGSALNPNGHSDSPRLKEMAGVNRISNNFKVVACSSRRKMKSSTPFLPEDIIFNILLWLPAEVLYNVMRYVCREWYNVINDPAFINAHLQKSTDALFIKRCIGTTSVCFLEMRDCDIQLRDSGLRLPQPIFGSCDGLVFCYIGRKRICYVTNPITKQVVILPPFFKTWQIRHPQITCVRSTGRYKVMLFICDENDSTVCLILSVGTDNAWRQIDIKLLPNLDRYVPSWNSFSTRGYIYLTFGGSCHLFALDAETEIFHQFSVPNVYHKAIRNTYIVWKNFLALVAHCAEFVWELWALTEFSTGEWTKLFSIDLRRQRCMIEQILDVPNSEFRSLDHYLSKQNLSLDRCLVPMASLKNGELVIFSLVDITKTYLVYNLKTGKVSSFVLGVNDKHAYTYGFHVNSLVSLKVS